MELWPVLSNIGVARSLLRDCHSFQINTAIDWNSFKKTTRSIISSFYYLREGNNRYKEQYFVALCNSGISRLLKSHLTIQYYQNKIPFKTSTVHCEWSIYQTLLEGFTEVIKIKYNITITWPKPFLTLQNIIKSQSKSDARKGEYTYLLLM